MLWLSGRRPHIFEPLKTWGGSLRMFHRFRVRLGFVLIHQMPPTVQPQQVTVLYQVGTISVFSSTWLFLLHYPVFSSFFEGLDGVIPVFVPAGNSSFSKLSCFTNKCSFNTAGSVREHWNKKRKTPLTVRYLCFEVQATDSSTCKSLNMFLIN